MSDEPSLNTAVPHSARIYDYLLGGSHHFDVDVDAAKRRWVKVKGPATPAATPTPTPEPAK